MRTVHESVVIVGAGPAGLAAAAAIAPHAPVLVLERESDAGGIPRHCHHPGFGLRDLHRSMRGPAYAEHLREAALAAGARIMTNAMVTGWADTRTLEVTSPQGRMLVSGDAIVLATGARERPRAARRIAGDRPAGVYNTGQLQQAVHLLHQPIGTRAVIVGSELVSWSALVTLRHAGCTAVMLTTEYERPDTYWLLAQAGRMAFRPELRTSTRVTRVIGKARVTGVEIEHVPSGGREVIACDTVVFTGDWIPDHELARTAGLAMDAGTRGPAVDASLRTDRPGVFAIGNLVHPVDTADVAALDGRHVAAAVLAHLRHDPVPTSLLAIEAKAPLRWVAPSRFAPGEAPAARGRLLLWSDAYVRFPTITVLQSGRVVGRRRLWWPAAPGRAFRVPWSVLEGITADGGPVELGID